jgi:hypothetical protein
MEQMLDIDMSTGLVVQDKVRSLCLGVELCVVCGDRASGTTVHALINVLFCVLRLVTFYLSCSM